MTAGAFSVICYNTPVTTWPAGYQKTGDRPGNPGNLRGQKNTLPQYPRNKSRKCLIMNRGTLPRTGGGLPQYPCKNPHKTFSDYCLNKQHRGLSRQTCYNTPVTTTQTARLAGVAWRTNRRQTLPQYPCKKSALCHNTPVKKGGGCHNTPVKLPQQTVANHGLNFLEIFLKRILESRPADSPARAGGPMPANRGLQDKGENTGRTFQKEAAGLAIVRATDCRPAGLNSL